MEQIILFPVKIGEIFSWREPPNPYFLLQIVKGLRAKKHLDPLFPWLSTALHILYHINLIVIKPVLVH